MLFIFSFLIKKIIINLLLTSFVLCQGEIGQTEIVWWQIEPYTTYNKSLPKFPTPFRGFFQAALLRLKRECPNSFSNSTWKFKKVVNPIEFETDATSSDSDGKITAFLPFSASSTLANSVTFQDDKTFFLPLIEVSISIYFFRKERESVGKDLMAVIAQGCRG